MNERTTTPRRTGLRAALAAGSAAALLATVATVGAVAPSAGANAVSAATAFGPAARPAATTGPLPATVTFSSPGHPVPRGFFGLAIEYNQLARYESLGAPFVNFLSLIRPRDGGPLWLRLGGKSADSAIWQPQVAAGAVGTNPDPLPRAQGVFGIGQTWLNTLSTLVRAGSLRLILDLNLAVHSPRLEVSFAQAAERTLPPGAVGYFEIGNEPNRYPNQPRLAPERVASTLRSTPWHWMTGYSPTDYRRDYVSYASALKAVLPQVPIGAPDVTADLPAWLTAVTGLHGLNPSFLAIHRYAGSSCWPRTSLYYPSVGLLLSTLGSANLASSVQGAVAYANSQHMQMRLTEINSISCGRDWGVADTFASALWAPQALLDLIETGVASVSWEMRPGNPAAPFNFSHGRMLPEPELYGLALFKRMTVRRPTIESGTVTEAQGLKLQAWAAVHPGGAEKVLLVNDGSLPADVTVPATRGNSTAAVDRLLGPAPGDSGGVTLAGQQVGPDGLWHGTRVIETVGAGSGGYSVLVPGYSAALVTPEP
jgi:hypothetical protein